MMDARRPDSFRTRALLHRAGLFGAIWAVLAARDAAGLIAGLAVVPLAVWLSLALIPARSPMDLWRVALHLPRFVAGSVAGGVDVARRAFARDMGLSPDWLRVEVDLPEGARTALGAEISLMPGTLAAGAEGRSLLVHRLTRGGAEGDVLSEVAALEAEIAAMLGDRAKDRAP